MTCIFHQNATIRDFNEFLEVTLILAGRRFQLGSQIQFSEERFVEEVAKPLITELIKEVKVTFQIPASLQGESAFDPQNLPQEAEGLESFGIKEVDDLAHYYGNPIQRKNKVFPAFTCYYRSGYATGPQDK